MMYFKGTGHVALDCKAIGVTVFAYGLTCCAGNLPTYCARWGFTQDSYSAMIKWARPNDPPGCPHLHCSPFLFLFSLSKENSTGFSYLFSHFLFLEGISHNWQKNVSGYLWMEKSIKSLKMGLGSDQLGPFAWVIPRQDMWKLQSSWKTVNWMSCSLGKPRKKSQGTG